MDPKTKARAKRTVVRVVSGGMTVAHHLGLTRVNLMRHRGRARRRLEIGPGPKRIPGFETLNVVGWTNVDYVHDATRTLPFPDDTFEIVYASHILEHVAWYQTAEVLSEWVRILEPGGALEIWVPHGLKIAKAWVAAEEGEAADFHQDGWWRFNQEKDPCVWANGRIFSYGDGTGRKDHQNWHFTVFSPRRLRTLMQQAGLERIDEMVAPDEVRGHDHGWINLGMRGFKPQG